MKTPKSLFVAGAVLACLLVPVHEANAWVAAARGGWGGGAVAVGGGYRGAYYHGGGCWGCGAAVGAVAGMAVGAAIATAAAPRYVQAVPVYVPTPVYTPAYVPTYVGVGNQVTTLPPGVNNLVVNGQQYYQSGSIWYKPYYGSSGVYYEVVQAP